MGIQIARSVAALRRKVAIWRDAGDRVALVPTMGALHAGHLSLVKLGRRRADRVVASIFVNPTQFAPAEDFSAYPRSWRQDVSALETARCDLVYAPASEEMYPDGFVTAVTLEGPAKAGLEDRFRPTHFAGVATVVAKLFAQCQPDCALFGEKDYQQFMVVTRMARDLDLPVKIVGAPTVREADGLAMSSRNRYLDAAERALAPQLHAALVDAADRIRAGGDPDEAAAEAARRIAAAGFEPDYLEARDARTLSPLTGDADAPIRLLAAARLGRTRLIDNIAV